MYIQFFLKCIISGSVIKLCSVCGRPHRTKSIEPIPTFRPLNEDIDMKVIVRSVCKCCNVEIHSHIQRTFSPTFITECKWDFIIGHLIVLTLDMADCVVDFFPIPFILHILYFVVFLSFNLFNKLLGNPTAVLQEDILTCARVHVPPTYERMFC